MHDYEDGWTEFKKVNEENYPDLKYRITEVEDFLRDFNKTLGEIREHTDFIKRSQKRKIPKNREVSGYEIYSVKQDQVAQSFLAIAKKWRHLKDYPRALEAYQMLIDRLPLMLTQAAEARYGIAEMYQFDQGRYFEAVDAYEDFIKHHPTYFRREEAIYNMAICYESLRQYENAYDTYKAYEETYPEGKYYKQAELKVRQFEFDEDGDGFPYYKEAAAGTSDTDKNAYPS
jgi:tetratricopeptide (TPR) repeat protein